MQGRPEQLFTGGGSLLGGTAGGGRTEPEWLLSKVMIAAKCYEE